MAGPSVGPDFYVAWPTAEIGFLEPLTAADVVYGNLPEEERMKLVEKMMADNSPYPAARCYALQDIIDPLDTRNYIINILDIVRASRGQGIGKHRLSNWPTKF